VQIAIDGPIAAGKGTVAKLAADAVEIDTSDMTIEEVVDKIIGLVKI